MKAILLLLSAIALFILSGCATTNSIPYKASTENIIAIQQSLQAQGKKVSIGHIVMADGVEEHLVCRMLGEVKVAPGKTLTTYVKDAFEEELFNAQVYDPNASTIINGKITALSFSSFAPANWIIEMEVSSNVSSGYTVNIKYPYNSSWMASTACQNVADAFGPAVQELLKQVVTHPKFAELAK